MRRRRLGTKRIGHTFWHAAASTPESITERIGRNDPSISELITKRIGRKEELSKSLVPKNMAQHLERHRVRRGNLPRQECKKRSASPHDTGSRARATTHPKKRRRLSASTGRSDLKWTKKAEPKDAVGQKRVINPFNQQAPKGKKGKV